MLGVVSIGFAQRQEGGSWILGAVLPVFKPLRQSTRSALNQAAELGVRVKVMSDWNELLVERSARVAGVESSLLRADIIDDLQLNQNDELVRHINEADEYPELNARRREMILTMLQQNGHRVTITGGDISHIPVSRKADLSVAITESPDRVQSVYDLVYTDAAHGLLSLISAIRSSRQAYQHAHNHMARQTIRTPHVLLAMLFMLLSEGKLMDLRLLLNTRTHQQQSQVDTPF
ncbi:hypothetical protein J3F84DRAFT_354827 [Trichoderma pleuroticola]